MHFPDNVTLEELGTKARDLDGTLKTFAVLAQQPPASPPVASVESGSLDLSVLLDRETWALAVVVLGAIGKGLELLTKLWGLRKSLVEQNLPTDAIDVRIEEEKKKLAEKALADVKAQLKTSAEPEDAAKAQRGASYMLEIITAGATVRALGSGPDVDPDAVNRLLAQAEPTIQLLRAPSVADSKLPREVDPKRLGPGGIDGPKK